MNFNEHDTLNADCEGVSGDEIIDISDNVANAIFYEKEYAFVGRESELDLEEPEALCCDGEATSLFKHDRDWESGWSVQPRRRLESSRDRADGRYGDTQVTGAVRNGDWRYA